MFSQCFQVLPFVHVGISVAASNAVLSYNNVHCAEWRFKKNLEYICDSILLNNFFEPSMLCTERKSISKCRVKILPSWDTEFLLLILWKCGLQTSPPSSHIILPLCGVEMWNVGIFPFWDHLLKRASWLIVAKILATIFSEKFKMSKLLFEHKHFVFDFDYLHRFPRFLQIF